MPRLTYFMARPSYITGDDHYVRTPLIMRFGLDYAWTTIAPAAHKAVGSSFACRYVSHDPTKNLTRAEAANLQAHGIDVVVVWESTANRALAGHVAGVQDAQIAELQAREAGMPAGRPIYFAVDFDEAPGQAGAVADYFRGVASVLGVERTGVYGGFWVVSRLFDAKLVHYAWQTYAWSGGNLDHRAQLYQFSNAHKVAGSDCDYDHALAEDFGQWSFKPAPPPKPKPHPTPPPAPDLRRFELQYNYAKGEFRVQALQDHKGGPDKWASVEGALDAHTGHWAVLNPLPWNAPPLGG